MTFRVTVVGAGYVGLGSALTLALTGHRVRVLDKDERRIAALARRSDPLREPYIETLLRSVPVEFTTDPRHAYERAEVALIAVGTPMTPSGNTDLSAVHEACQTLALHAPTCAVLIRSTVAVGTADKLQRGELRRNRVISNPEFLREGHVIADALRPTRLVAGGAPQDEPLVRDLYRAIIAQDFAPLGTLAPWPEPRPFHWMDRRSAELTKYAANAFLATKLSFVNEIANIAAHVNADIRPIASALAADPRIGPSFMRPGIGWGGSCFPKDTRGLVALAVESGHDLMVLRAAIEQNNAQLQRFFQLMVDAFAERGDVTLALLGLAFKAGTSDCRESPAVALAELMIAEGWCVKAYDPAVAAPDPHLPPGLMLTTSALDAAADADALVVATEWPEFAELDFIALRGVMRGRLLFDGRCIIDPAKTALAGLEYRGICPPSSSVGD